MKHWKRIPNATRTSFNLASTSTWWTSSSKTSYKKDEEKEFELKRMPRILMSLIGQQKLVGKANLKGKPKWAQIERLQNWTTNPIKVNRETKWSKARETTRARSRIWVLSTKERKRQKENCLKNNTKHKNERLQRGHLDVCSRKKDDKQISWGQVMTENKGSWKA